MQIYLYFALNAKVILWHLSFFSMNFFFSMKQNSVRETQPDPACLDIFFFSDENITFYEILHVGNQTY